MIRVGVDVGGTHTDLVLIDEARGGVFVHKVPSTKDDPSIGTIEGVAELCRSSGVSADAIDAFMHGTTITTNIVLEHNGARTGLITTEGFRDILHIARHKRPQTFSLQLDLPWQSHPLVPRERRLTVPERIAASGEILVPLDEAATRTAARRLVAAGVEAIAVCFLFSFLNPAHERRVGEIIAEEAPRVFISLSHEVIPQYREYERFSTTALNAYVGPKTVHYLDRLSKRLAAAGVAAALRLMQSSGGAATVDAAVRRPVNLLMSGPAGGLLGGIFAGKSAGFENFVTLDVGGTSADIGVAPGGEVLFKHMLDTRLGDYHAMLPMAEIDAIGAGGGSIAYLDAGGQFQVGPKSAGSDPGPSCYGRGGMEPTATDCMLALGRLDPSGLLGGRMPLDAELALAAISDRLSGPLGLSIEAAALGAVKILTHNMVQAIEVNSVRRGYDPRDFVLVAFGGAGPLIACEIASELGIPSIVIPPMPGLTSAVGLLTTDVAYDRGTTLMQVLSEIDLARLAAQFEALEARIGAQLKRDGFCDGRTRFLRVADCRYCGQGHELRTPAAPGPVDADFVQQLRAAFDRQHERAYGHAYAGREVELVNIRVVGIGAVPPLRIEPIAAGATTSPDGAMTGRCRAVFDIGCVATTIDTPRYARALLLGGQRIAGPAIIDQMDATTVIPPGFAGRVDRVGNLVITSA